MVDIMAAGTKVHFAEATQLVGVTLDQTSSIDRHIANVARSCSDHTRALRHITSVLSLECVKELSAVD